MKTFAEIHPCPCNSQLAYKECCQGFHTNAEQAESAEQLMRSRYCAFVVNAFDYLIKTHHQTYLNGLTAAQLALGNTQWLGLAVLEHGLIDSHHVDFVTDLESSLQAFVTFKAWYKHGKSVDAIFERSHFVQQNGQWFYTQGVQMEAALPKRNDACVCHSGKKFKLCCGK
ncbi:YchJ family protein [Shewanella holmiensis]|uniref:YchJ family protein n=1 Tax=Shewanella holmiensis TaxID=2952222 RepID=A0A9X2WP91_9GAMM|nr:YchJ family protein [Shewanella holmiensis]MCT7943027.1 YchJ family protein [Shewanella holmiensis]